MSRQSWFVGVFLCSASAALGNCTNVQPPGIGGRGGAAGGGASSSGGAGSPTGGNAGTGARGGSAGGHGVGGTVGVGGGGAIGGAGITGAGGTSNGGRAGVAGGPPNCGTATGGMGGTGRAGHGGNGPGENTGGAGGVAGGAGGGAAGSTATGGAGGATSQPALGRLIAPLPGVNVTSRRPQLRWLLPSATDGANIELCRDPACATVMMTLEAAGTTATPTTDLPSGLLFWRARWRSNGAVTVAAPTPIWRFRVPSHGSPTDRTAGTTIDVNGDGYADVVVGVSPTPGQLVRAYAYHGSATGLPALPSGSLFGVQASATAYVSVVASLGDINADGYTDVGVEYQTVTKAFGGDVAEQVSIYMGGPNGLSRSPAITYSDPGNAIAAAGDVNGDGYSDFVVGGSANFAHLYLGGPAGPPPLPSLTFFNMLLNGMDSFFVWTAGSAGDLNGDGYGDVVVGSIGGLPRINPGYVYLGGPAGLGPDPAVQLFLLGDGNPIGLYYVTSFGDINGDGFADLVAGVTGSGGLVGPTEQAPEKMAAVYLGTPNLLFNVGLSGPASPSFSLVSNQNMVIDNEVSLANAGDVNSDGYDDIVVGGDQPANATGQAYVYLGVAGAVGLSVSPSLVIPGPDGPGQRFGTVVVGPGDVNGDGYSDVVVSDLKGQVYVFEGSPTGVSPTPAIILSAPDGATTIFGPNIAN